MKYTQVEDPENKSDIAQKRSCLCSVSIHLHRNKTMGKIAKKKNWIRSTSMHPNIEQKNEQDSLNKDQVEEVKWTGTNRWIRLEIATRGCSCYQGRAKWWNGQIDNSLCGASFLSWG
ncbi:hypothetical protein LOAG_00158 [Loa loa]|uniref:Uncharacterized protein n=1 Tax=Loa loa TaxID=7209 RepID=A0A1S0UC58_LOALO|nr:hypothetical protein LOAG_00158 [Loa loa]EFO28339.1 hypothetical protein LOAG_00158 [Loa loa]